MQADEIVRTPAVGVVDPRRKTGGVGGSQESVSRGTGKAHVKIPVPPQKCRQFLPDGIYEVLLAQSVSLCTCIGILRVMPLVDINFY